MTKRKKRKFNFKGKPYAEEEKIMAGEMREQ
jgi:hypothetical protein